MAFGDIDPAKLLADVQKMSADLEIQKGQIFEKLEVLNKWNLFKGISKVESSGPKTVSVQFDSQEEADAFLTMFKK